MPVFAGGESSPVGTASPFNVAEVIQSAGAYSSLTGTTTRTVPDLVVPGGVGAYPMVFSRSSTSRYMPGDEGNDHAFGQAGTWRHNYKWALFVEKDAGGNPTGIRRLHYPDGRVIKFTNMPVYAPASTYSAPPADPYLRCMSIGVAERLQKIANDHYLLHMSDGGTVDLLQVGDNFRVTYVADPYGQKTLFSYWTYDDNANGVFLGKLQRVTEPAGRWLEFKYISFCGSVLMRFVAASTSQSVQYDYQTAFNYIALVSATYRNDTTINGQTSSVATAQATYDYQADNTGAGLRPLLKTCNDPLFQGPMPRISYAFKQGNSYPYGQIQAESGIADNGTPTVISSYDQANNQETNGLGGQTTFAYYAYLLNTRADNDGTNTTNTNYTYDANWFRKSVTNRNNNTTNATCEPYTGRPLSVTQTDNTSGSDTTLITTCNYDPTGAGATYVQDPYWIMRVTDPRGHNTTYTRDGSHQVTQVTYTDGTFEKFAYNGFGQVTSHLKTDGSSENFWFDNAGNRTASTESFSNGAIVFDNRASYPNPTSPYTAYQYNEIRGRLSQVTDVYSNSTGYTYDDFHRLTRITYPDGKQRKYTYDAYGNLSTASDEVQKVTIYAYDNHRRPKSITVPVKQDQSTSLTTTFTYERGATSGDTHTQRGFGTVTFQGAPGTQSDKQFRRAYTKKGRLQSETKGYGTATAITDTYTYDGEGHLKTVNANGITQASYEYDSLERKRTVTEANGHMTTWTYYPGNDPSGYAGWLKSVQTPGNTAGGQPLTTKYTAYDVMGRVQITKDPATNQVTRSYDSVGRLQYLSDANGTYQYEYDALSRPRILHFPDTTTQKWNYDNVGNQILFKNRAGSKYTTYYNNRNRPYQADWDDGLTVGRRWYYDDAGRLRELFNGYSDINYTYDDHGFMLTEAETTYYNGAARTNTVTYAEDSYGNVASITYPAGDVPNYTYDGQNRCIGLTGWSLLGFQGERVAYRSLANRLYTQYHYQPNNRVDQVWQLKINPDNSLSNVSQRNYGYAPNGQVTWCNRTNDGNTGAGAAAGGSGLENEHGENYQYGGDNSLSAFSILYGGTWQPADNYGDSNANPSNLAMTAPGAGGPGSYVNNYTYDGSGNRSQVKQMGASIGYGVDQENRYSGSTYDANSNTTDSVVGWTYEYNAEGQMTSARRQSDNYTFNFVYDGAGRQIARTVNGAGAVFCYAGLQRIEQRDFATGASVYRYFFDAPGSDTICFRQTSNGQMYQGPRLFYQYDAMGNTTHVSDDDGLVLEQYLYDAYGTPYVYNKAGSYLGNASQRDNHQLFHGSSAYEWLTLPGLYYCRARMYLPAHGRWLQSDPSGFAAGDVNLYRYCGNDPVNAVDPSGLIGFSWLSLFKWEWGSAGSSGGSGIGGSYSAGDYGTGSHIPNYNVGGGAGAGGSTYTPTSAVGVGGYAGGGWSGKNGSISGSEPSLSNTAPSESSGSTADYVGNTKYPTYDTQNFPTNPIIVEAIDVANLALGVLGNAIGILQGVAGVTLGVLSVNTGLIKQGYNALTGAIVPRYGAFDGPGWGIPETYFGQRPTNSPNDVGGYVHDILWGEARTALASGDIETARNLRTQGNNAINSISASGPVGVFGTVYRAGIGIIFRPDTSGYFGGNL